MFERYTENARRSLFFARYEVAQCGGLTIEPEHLLLGVLRGAPQAILRFTGGSATSESIRAALAAAAPAGERVSTSVEVPFSAEAKTVLQHTVVEADAAGNQGIVPEHIVLGVLVKTSGGASRVLQDAGVEVAAMRRHLAAMPEDSHEGSAGSPMIVPGTVARQWKGVVRPGQADTYLAHLREDTIPALTRLDGFRHVSILRREVEDGTEFQVTTVWRSSASIEAFAGADVTMAVVPPAAQALMVRYDERAAHYEIVQ